MKPTSAFANTLARPKHPLQWQPIHPRSLLPIVPPSSTPSIPSLPSPARQPSSTQPWLLTTHIIPAAFPRTSPALPVPPTPPPGADKPTRLALAAENLELIMAHRQQQIQGDWDGQGSRKVLWNCVNRYAPLRNPSGGLTLLFVHATGFPKEIWEPTLHHLLSSSSGPIIDEIWSWESVQHGDAALLNSENLDGIFDWSDNTRDILNFLLNYLPSNPVTATLPTHLARISPAEQEHRHAHGFDDRKLVLIGHSFGGCTSALAAISRPNLFHSLVLVDPVIICPGTPHPSTLVMGALTRRDTWPSRHESHRLLKQSPFFSSWHPDVLTAYIEYGLCSDPTHPNSGDVQLKTPSVQEAICFAQSLTSSEVWQLMGSLDERVPVKWIVPGKPGDPGIGGLEMTQTRVWLRPKNSSNVVIPSAGHLIPQEAPGELAREIGEFLRDTYGSRRAVL